VLALAAGRTSALFRKLVALLQFCKFLFKIHGARIIAVAIATECAARHTAVRMTEDYS
jgi:hypothetical protein